MTKFLKSVCTFICESGHSANITKKQMNMPRYSGLPTNHAANLILFFGKSPSCKPLFESFLLKTAK